MAILFLRITLKRHFQRLLWQTLSRTRRAYLAHCRYKFMVRSHVPFYKAIVVDLRQRINSLLDYWILELVGVGCQM